MHEEIWKLKGKQCDNGKHLFKNKKSNYSKILKSAVVFCAWISSQVLAGFSPLANGLSPDKNKLRPDYTLVNLRPSGFKPNVSALGWYPGGKLLVVEWSKSGIKQVEIRQFNGTIYLLEGVQKAKGPGDVKVSIFADKLEIPTGVKVLGDTVFVASGFTLDGHIDSNNDGKADNVHKVFNFGYEKKCRHEFFMGLLYKDNHFYASGSRCKDQPTRPQGVHSNTWQLHKGRGALYKINRWNGKAELLAGGMRQPYGMGVGPGGDFFECDNQGSWKPGSAMYHLQKGRFYGFQADNFTPEQDYGPEYKNVKTSPPAIWMPHSAASNSPTHPLLVKHGIFQGQMLIGDMAYGGIQRAFLEKVNGEWQGAYFNWSGGFEAGVGALLWTDDGQLIVGGQGMGDNNNWGWLRQKEGLQKIVPKPGAPVVFEPLAVRSRQNGFEIEFTKPVNKSAALNKGNYTVRRYEQKPSRGYGAGNMANNSGVTVSSVNACGENRVFLSMDLQGQVYRGGKLQPNTVVFIQMGDITSSTGDKLWVNRAWYTLNSISGSKACDDIPVKVLNPISEAVTVKMLRSRRMAVQVGYQGPHRVEVFNLQGKLLSARKGLGSAEYTFTNLPNRRMFIVKVTSDRESFVKKCMFI